MVQFKCRFCISRFIIFFPHCVSICKLKVNYKMYSSQAQKKGQIFRIIWKLLSCWIHLWCLSGFYKSCSDTCGRACIAAFRSRVWGAVSLFPDRLSVPLVNLCPCLLLRSGEGKSMFAVLKLELNVLTHSCLKLGLKVFHVLLETITCTKSRTAKSKYFFF